ncbi:hypothetical protein QX776_03160 [Alteromonadaceae bacterium BrNp21-10]|nr:hypothetical protein [Alteromonadaceae bacterium BrNp21-10]
MSKQSAPQETYSANWMQSLDGRTAIAQELRQRHIALTDDLGGLEQLSYQQKALVERALWLEYHLQQEELKLANGQEFDSGKWTQACNALQGIFGKLGLNRVAKTIPALKEYVKGSK